MGVGRQEVDGERPPLGQLDLGQDRIGLQVQAYGRGHVLVAEHGGAREVHQQIGAPE